MIELIFDPKKETKKAFEVRKAEAIAGALVPIYDARQQARDKLKACGRL